MVQKVLKKQYYLSAKHLSFAYAVTVSTNLFQRDNWLS